jgi:membrane protein DedA with SNARE-associated domain
MLHVNLPLAQMSHTLSLVVHHGYLVIFLIVLGEAVGMPVPSSLALIAGGAAVASGSLRLPTVAMLAVVAMLLGDTLFYVLGNLMGWNLLGFLCRVSLNPETCILRAAESFYKRGRAALLVAKFIPGVNTMAAPLAGSMEMPFVQFLGLDFLGATLYAFAYLGVGYFFRDFIATITRGFQVAGHVVEIVVILAAIVFVAHRVWLYWKHRADRVVPRVQVAELVRKLQSVGPGNILLVDVRSHGYYDPGAARIQGSIRLEPNNLSDEIKNLPKDKDIYLYCT